MLASTLQSFREAGLAQNWDDFLRAFAGFGGPGQNVVYADVDGHIGYHATGWVPLRKSGDATKPVPGNVDTYDWTGYLPFDKMPSVFDPPSGIIGTANGRATPDGYPLPDQRRVDGALPHRPHLPGPAVGQEILRRRHARAADRHLFRY